MAESKPTRSPLTSRNSKWAATMAGWLVKKRVQPNHISVFGLVLVGKAFDLLQPALIVICLGCLVTIARRAVCIVRELESK